MRWMPTLLMVACAGSASDSATAPPSDGADGATDGADGAGDGADGAADGADGGDTLGVEDVTITVTLDGAPVEGANLWQGGIPTHRATDAAGQAVFPVDRSLDADIVVMATHPDARIGLLDLSYGDFPTAATIELYTFVDIDNLAYTYQHPGTPDLRESTAYCAHCHISMSRDWVASPHASAASNPWLHDLYAGAAAALSTRADCLAAGGAWATGTGPGTAAAAERCYLGDGVLPDLNDCDVGCDSAPAAQPETGDCADCHAPGIDGAAGGRGLLEATDVAFDHGVHCDVCHKVESVDLEADAPGVAGRLRILRPLEDVPIAGLTWTPITFGPYPDVPNPRMGVVVRDHYANGQICAGCHEYWQPVKVPGAAIDTDRWPDGLLPIHTTWSELETGALGTDVPCQSCHMPPDGDAGNAADLGNEADGAGPGIAAGWWRPAGAVRRHVWFGPRSDEQRMIDLAARLEATATLDGGALVAQVTTSNVGPGHAIPTGEPLRALLVQVEARCGATAQPAVGGDALPAWAGALDQQDATGDWSVWPGAAVGDRITVVSSTGWHDYEGPLVFGDGSFTPEERGLPVEHVVGHAAVTAVAGDAVTLDGALPTGDRAYRTPAPTLAADGDPAAPLAGAPGFAFARVLTGADGAAMVPHFKAVDVQSDNRLMPGASHTSTHRFSVDCADPVVEARLLHRPAPWSMGLEKRWDNADAVMATARVEVTP